MSRSDAIRFEFDAIELGLGDRNILDARLEEVLGKKPAAILMQQLPPFDNLATKADIGVLATRLDGLDTRMDALDTRMDALDTRMDGLETRMDRLDGRMERLDGRMDRLEDRFHGFHDALREQTRQFILMLAGAMVTLTAAVFAMTRAS